MTHLKKIFMFIGALGLCGLTACNVTLPDKSTTEGGVCTSDSIESACAAESSELLTLTSRRPLVIKSGDTVALTGTGFNKAMSATVGGIAVTSLTVTSATSASLVVPAGVATGMSELKLTLNTVDATASMAYTPRNDIPLMTVAATEVCAGVAFYDINGDSQTGTKSCSGSSSTPACAANGAIDCVTNSSYKSADFTNLVASNIKSGVTVAGVAGNYTSSSGSSGTPPDAWDLRAGTTVSGVTGKLKVNCRNAISNTYYNYDGAVASINGTGVTSGTTNDIWDTIDDFNGQPPSSGFPAAWTASVASNYYCGGVEATAGDDKAWKDVTTTNGTTASTCAGTSANCTMKDKISGLEWSKIQTSGTWPQAINDCDALTHNGASDWRLPTQKELMGAYEHGAISAQSTNWITTAQMQGMFFWSSSTRSVEPSNAWGVYLSEGTTRPQPMNGKTGTYQVACVR